VPTGFAELDQITNGLHPGQMVIVAARPAIGKALALDTALPTPDGWTTMGQVQVGARLIGADGKPTTVVAATQVMTGRRCYEVEFSDGTVIVADAQHQWRTTTHAARRAGTERRPAALHAGVRPPVNSWHAAEHTAVVTTQDLAGTLRCTSADRRPNHAVVLAAPLQLPDATLPVPPYTLGAWLRECTADAAKIAAADPETLLGDTRIPAAYLRASEAQRRALLAGLLDTDGTVSPTRTVVFAVTNRRLAEDVRELALSLGYRATISTRAVRGRTAESSTCYSVCFTPPGPVFRLGRKLARQERSVRTADRRYVVDVRPVPSVPVRCVQVDNADHMYLASRSMVPTHNSTLALDFSRACSIKHGLTSVIFSLEMSKSEITMRLLSAEAKVPLHHMRSGHMSDDDWARLARRMGEVADAPLYIDDSPNLTMMEIRAKARRLKQRHDLRLVIVDYLQLMTSGKRVESRQVEVSEFSRSLKLLAKELEVPVVAISQLNRGPEQRTDKKPLLSDLRESGCLPASSRVLRADTGAEVALGELLAAGARDVPVWSFDERLRVVPRTLTHVFSSGRKEVFRLRLASGRTIDATANHPFRTYDGWKPLGELAAGSRLAAPRSVPAPLETRSWADSEVILLGHLLGAGSFVRRQPLRYASVDGANLAAVTEAARHFGIVAVRDDHHPAARCTSLRLPAPHRLTDGRRNPIAAWLDGLGLFGLRSHEKFVPAGVFSLPDTQLALFLRHLWATDGSVSWYERDGHARLYYASTSRRLVDDLARLLLRFGVLSRCTTVRKAAYRDAYHLHVDGAENQLRFLTDIGIQGARGDTAARVAGRLAGMVGTTNLETVPREVWQRVRTVLGERSASHREFAAAMGTQFCGSTLWKHAPGRQRLGRVAAVLDAADLEMLTTNDVFWDEVASVESLGEQEVYDATVLGTHNFIADGVVVHNSLEQDADMVVLLHREDAYERESPRAGEADLILAKHRNGPTGLVTVAFQGHYSRFVDMAT